MRTRLLFGGLAAALALAVAAPAHAAEVKPACADGFEVICTVLALTCVISGEQPCHP
ncbi:MAG: hypothetical protein QOE45_2793 [Frankiaceae bacterium]|jgi:hypothetical protein|nr:hypothetical protein [Frankiaceae bacterium]